MKLALASDMHGKIRRKFPQADVLVLGGDIFPNLARSKKADAPLQRLYAQDTLAPWLISLVKHYDAVVMIPGNHDRCFEFYRTEMTKLIEKCGVHLLLDSAKEIGGLKFWGSPWTPWFYGQHWSFNFPCRKDNPARARAHARNCWELIPDDTDVLITHGPPQGILDLVPVIYDGGGHVGCPYLLERVQKVKPKLHVFGHIHKGHGITTRDGTMFVNASIMNGKFKPANHIRVVNI